MFEDYIQDAATFYQLAETKKTILDEREAKMYYRAAIFCTASALEAFVNLIGNTFNQGNSLDKNEIAFLNDKALEISPAKGIIEEKTKFYSIESKIKFIIKKFNVAIDLASAYQWKDFLQFKELRDSLIHSKSIEDERSMSDYGANIKRGLNANIDIMNAISIRVFAKPLRRSLTDLKI